MVIDVYLQLDGIEGASAADAHKNWIECTDVRWGITKPRSATSSTGGGHTAQRVDMRDLMLSKVSDISSSILMQYCAMGKTIPRATLAFMHADGDGEPSLHVAAC